MADLLTLTGIDAVRQRLQAIATTMLPLAGMALQHEAEAIRDASLQLVPYDTGALAASALVHDVEVDRNSASIEISYGGPGTGFARTPSHYAIIVHESTTMRHPHGGQSHYLSQPVFEATQEMLDRLADALRL